MYNSNNDHGAMYQWRRSEITWYLFGHQGVLIFPMNNYKTVSADLEVRWTQKERSNSNLHIYDDRWIAGKAKNRKKRRRQVVPIQVPRPRLGGARWSCKDKQRLRLSECNGKSLLGLKLTWNVFLHRCGVKLHFLCRKCYFLHICHGLYSDWTADQS